MPIPNGTSVVVEDAPNIAYEWRDGNVIKVVDDSVVESLEGHEFRGLFGTGVSGWSVAFLGINIVLFGALGWWYLRRGPNK